MKTEDFITLVSKMRDAQKHYFKYKSNDALRLAKTLEHQVDQGLRALSELPL